MKEVLHQHKTFEKIDYSGKELSGREFDSCTFKHCNFSNSILSKNDFIDCRFEDCNLTLIKLNHSSLKNVHFINCKLMGVDFSPCNDFLLSVSFEKCILDYCAFFGKKLKKTTFRECSIKEANFTSTDLTASGFIRCDLTHSVFQQSILEKVDFSTSQHYSIDPELNKIKKASFSLHGLAGLLDKYDIVIE